MNAVLATAAVERLSILRYFPSTELQRDEIAALIMRMVPNEDALNEWVTAMIDAGEWRGPYEARGVLCAIADPADGIKVACRETPGWTPADLEARWQQKQSAVKQLPPVKEPPLTDEERQWIADFNAKLAARSRPESPEKKNYSPEGFAEWQARVERERDQKTTEQAWEELGR